MIVCICANVSDKKVIKYLSENQGIETVKDLRKHLPVCAQCFKCKKELCSLIESLK